MHFVLGNLNSKSYQVNIMYKNYMHAYCCNFALFLDIFFLITSLSTL